MMAQSVTAWKLGVGLVGKHWGLVELAASSPWGC